MPSIYEVLFSDAHKEACLILLMNELRGTNPTTDSSDKIRADLAKLKTLSELVDLEYILEHTIGDKQEEQEPDDELPAIDGYASEEPDANL